MTNKKFEDICNQMRKDIFDLTPYDTGNLADKATKIARISNARFEIYVDQTVAPYFKYVNGAPTLTYRRYQKSISGKKIIKRKDLPKVSFTVRNRNYQYFERAFEKALENMAHEIGGTIYRV